MERSVKRRAHIHTKDKLEKLYCENIVKILLHGMNLEHSEIKQTKKKVIVKLRWIETLIF